MGVAGMRSRRKSTEEWLESQGDKNTKHKGTSEQTRCLKLKHK